MFNRFIAKEIGDVTNQALVSEFSKLILRQDILRAFSLSCFDSRCKIMLINFLRYDLIIEGLHDQMLVSYLFIYSFILP